MTAGRTTAKARTVNPGLVDRIYECAFLPDLWPEVLDDISTMADVRGGTLYAGNADAGTLRWTASAGVREHTQALVSGGWLTRGDRRVRSPGVQHAGFLTLHDLYTDEELKLDPLYRDFLRPRGLGPTAATEISLPTGDTVIFSFGREHVRGPIGAPIVRRLDALRPHLARSALLSARLQLERARAVSETLGLLGLPALVFDQRGAVIAADPMIEALTDHVRWRSRDRVSLKDSSADALFLQAIATLDVDSATPVRSFAVRDADAGAALVAHVVPIRRTARDLFTRGAGVLVLTAVIARHAPSVELVQSLFDLTPAEARVARHLVAGDTVEEIATVGAVSANTVRTQVRGVMEKTGCRRQAEVVALLGGITVGAPAR